MRGVEQSLQAILRITLCFLQLIDQNHHLGDGHIEAQILDCLGHLEDGLVKNLEGVFIVLFPG